MWKKFLVKVKNNLLLWGTSSTLIILAIYLELFATAARRPFSLTDKTISYPFIENEKYGDISLLLLGYVFPQLLMLALVVTDSKGQKFFRFYKTISCFTFAVALAVFTVTFSKIRLAKLRPDFLARCGPVAKSLETSSQTLYTEEVCSSPFGKAILNDGYKSCPSGHSTISMCGMLFLSLWLFRSYGQNQKSGVLKLLCFAPLFLALDVITSRIYDFKHDYFDILSGSIVGAGAVLVSGAFIELNEDDDSDVDPLLPL